MPELAPVITKTRGSGIRSGTVALERRLRGTRRSRLTGGDLRGEPALRVRQAHLLREGQRAPGRVLCVRAEDGLPDARAVVVERLVQTVGELAQQRQLAL